MRKVFLSGMSMLSSVQAYSYLRNGERGIETPFPVLDLLDRYAREGEEVVMMTIVARSDDRITYAQSNYALFCEAAGKLFAKRRLNGTFIEIGMPNAAKPDSHRRLFQEIVRDLREGDVVYADITYGFKSTPIVVFSALHYAYKTKQNIEISQVSYGNLYNGTADLQPEIFDLTELFYLNSLAGTLGSLAAAEQVDVLDIVADIHDKAR